MANGIHRDILELTLAQFRLRYGGEFHEHKLSEMRLASEPDGYLLHASYTPLPNSDASIYLDNTKVVTRIELANFTPGTIAAVTLGGNRNIIIPYGASYEIKTSEQLGINGLDFFVVGSPYLQTLVFGYTPPTDQPA